jgi:hypothetical protein
MEIMECNIHVYTRKHEVRPRQLDLIKLRLNVIENWMKNLSKSLFCFAGQRLVSQCPLISDLFVIDVITLKNACIMNSHARRRRLVGLVHTSNSGDADPSLPGKCDRMNDILLKSDSIISCASSLICTTRSTT